MNIRLTTTCLLALAALAFTGVQAQERDTLGRGMSRLFVGRLNWDCYPDTVLGTRDRKFNYLPRLVLWGKPPAGAPGDRQNTVRDCLGPIPDSLKVRATQIIYPQWEGLAASASFRSFNADSLADMFFTLRGTTGLGSERHDTSRMVLVFGQHGLDTLARLDLSGIDVFQYAPFFAMQMRKGAEVVGKGVRDLSGKPSWQLMPVEFTPRPPDTAVHGGGGPVAGVVRAIPNPANTTTDIAATKLPAGHYDVEMVGVNGAVAERAEVELAVPGNLLRTLDVRRLASGYYMVRLLRQGKLVGTYPVIVTR